MERLKILAEIVETREREVACREASREPDRWDR